MNDVIEKLSNFVENQYKEPREAPGRLVAINEGTVQAKADFSWSEGNKVPNNTEIHNAMTELLPEVDKIANESFEFPPLHDDKESSSGSEEANDNKVTNDLYKTQYYNIELKNQPENASRNNAIHRPCKEKQHSTFGKAIQLLTSGVDHRYKSNRTARSISDHLKIVDRLYDTQTVYDNNLEVGKFLAAQKEIRSNQEKPVINSNSRALCKEKSLKPIYLRAPEVILKSNDEMARLKELITQQRLQKEIEEFEEIERNRVDKKTKGK